ncbi:MAG TPA: cytochrome C [Candidatus Binatia bacterium]
MRSRILIIGGTLVAVVAAVGVAARSGADGPRQDLPKHDVPKSKDGNLVVALCDGETTVEVEGVAEGQELTREQAQRVSDQLMAEWKKKNPNARWEDRPVQVAQASAPSGAAGSPSAGAQVGSAAGAQNGSTGAPPVAAGEPPGAAVGTPGDEKVQTGIYSAFTERDEKIWQAATDQFVKDGHRIFHDAKAFGGTIGVSCDMCHPDAANTHPETYPKFQVQLGRVAMLRDMINWCIENPARGKPLPDDDVRLKAMEAYILAQRKGVPLDYGKH